jgi:protein-tyrosine phosphatase
MAEGAFREGARANGLACLVDSAGTASYHVGSPPDSRAIAVAARHGIDIARQAARQIERDDFYRFHHIVALDRANLEGVRSRAPRDGTARLSMLMDAVEGRAGEGVADPYYGDDAAFEAAWDAIRIGVAAWLERLQREAAALRS